MSLKDASPPGIDQRHLHAQIADLEVEKRELELEIEQLLSDRDFAASEKVREAQMELEAILCDCNTIYGRIERTHDPHVGKEERSPAAARAIIQSIGNDAESALPPSYRRIKDVISPLLSQYGDLCHEERAIEDMVERELEKRERVAREKLESAEMELDSTQRIAVEIIGAMEQASGGDLDIGFWGRSGAASTSTTEPVAERPDVQLASLEQTSGTPAPPAGGYPHVAPTSIIRPPIHAEFTKLQVSIFQKYERGIEKALNSESNLVILQVPWPIFAPALSGYPTTNLEKGVFKQDAITHFFHMYIGWKGWDLRVGREAILQDWMFLLSQIPQSKRGGHMAATRTVAALHTLV